MTDPFATLHLFADFTAAAVSDAFAAALRRGVPVVEARMAMDALRDPDQRSAMELVAPSMSIAAQRERRRMIAHDMDPAGDILRRYLGHAIQELDSRLAASAVVPRREFKIDEYLPPLPDHLRP